GARGAGDSAPPPPWRKSTGTQTRAIGLSSIPTARRVKPCSTSTCICLLDVDSPGRPVKPAEQRAHAVALYGYDSRLISPRSGGTQGRRRQPWDFWTESSATWQGLF